MIRSRLHIFLENWTTAWYKFASNRGALLSLLLIFLITVASIICPMISKYTVQEMDLEAINCAPFSDHYFGTDGAGRDLWTRVWSGTRISLLVAGLAVLLDVVIGVLYGGISGYFGGFIDTIMQRIVEILQGIPRLVVLILLILFIKPGIVPIAIAIALTGWFNMALIVRAQILQLKSQEYVLAAKVLGATDAWIILKHLIPNMLSSIIVTATFTIPMAMFFEIFLSFIGLGMPVEAPSLGTLLMYARPYMQIYPYQLGYPIFIIILLMIAFNLLGDGLRDALDPKSSYQIS